MKYKEKKMLLLPSVLLVGSGSNGIFLTDFYDCNVYLIDCNSELVLIDSGAGYDIHDLVQQIELANPYRKKISWILLTHAHADHSGGASQLKELYKCKIAAPINEAAFIQNGNEHEIGLDLAREAGIYPDDFCFHPCNIDLTLSPHTKLEIGDVCFSILSAAGHSNGGVCFYIHKDNKNILFAGDLLTSEGKISLQNIPGVNLTSYRESILELQNLSVDCFFPGHGCFALKNGHIHIAPAIAAFKGLFLPKNSL
jgi:glyoxylase-like metal-dependent hydrolase (beta-lactamase superfamily II)